MGADDQRVNVYCREESVSDLGEILENSIQTYRSQGADGPPNAHELIVQKEFHERIPNYGRDSLLTPYLFFANGWEACLDFLRKNDMVIVGRK